MTQLTGQIVGLFVGRAEERWPGKPPSAIGKQPVAGPLELGATGFVDDSQADLKVHGGPEKAVHHYASEHMDYWRAAYDAPAGRFAPGCFGENISTRGLDETNLCLGDILSLGSARVQVCQGRQPCWKLNAHTGLGDMAMRFQKTGRTGWYYRVLEGGRVSVGDSMTVLDRPHAAWPLERLIAARFDPAIGTGMAAELAAMTALSESWRAAFARKAGGERHEDTSARLGGP